MFSLNFWIIIFLVLYWIHWPTLRPNIFKKWFFHFQIRSYAPDLAKTIAGLILSSSDLDFQGECFSLLGLQSQEVGTEIVENCIEERIVSVIEMNDKKSYNSQEPAPFLFEEDPVEELEFQENDFSPLNSLLF